MQVLLDSQVSVVYKVYQASLAAQVLLETQDLRVHAVPMDCLVTQVRQVKLVRQVTVVLLELLEHLVIKDRLDRVDR